MVTGNGCNEDGESPNGLNPNGWDLYEAQTKEEFEFYAHRRGYLLDKDELGPMFYANPRTQDAWEMYHKGHVMGRGWKA